MKYNYATIIRFKILKKGTENRPSERTGFLPHLNTPV